MAQRYSIVMLTQAVWRNSDAYRRDFVSSECGTDYSKTINLEGWKESKSLVQDNFSLCPLF
jgi:hypothetical protein